MIQKHTDLPQLAMENLPLCFVPFMGSSEAYVFLFTLKPPALAQSYQATHRLSLESWGQLGLVLAVGSPSSLVW